MVLLTNNLSNFFMHVTQKVHVAQTFVLAWVLHKEMPHNNLELVSLFEYCQLKTNKSKFSNLIIRKFKVLFLI